MSELGPISKKNVVAAFIDQLERDLAQILSAAKATHEAATNEESKPENQYDTRALEASYLASAQAKRAAEIEETLALFRQLSGAELGRLSKVRVGALAKVLIDGKPTWLMMMAKGGGSNLSVGAETVQIVTPSSALGSAILDLSAGASTEFEAGPKTRECEVVEVY